MMGTDMLLNSLLSWAGVEPEKAKADMADLVRRFHEQDRLLRESHAMQKAICAHFGISVQLPTGELGNDERSERLLSAGNGTDAA